MKTLFVVLPQGIENAVEATAKIALAASTKLGEYLCLVSGVPYAWGLHIEDTVKRENLAYFLHAIEYMSRADYVAFAPEWQKHKECRLLHDIAEQYELDIIECDAPEPELKPCPFCGANLEGSRHAFAFGTQAMGYIVCPNCGTISGFGRTYDESVDAWNSRGDEA